MTTPDRVTIVVLVVVGGLMLAVLGMALLGGSDDEPTLDEPISEAWDESTFDTDVREHFEQACGYPDTEIVRAEWTTYEGQSYYARWFETGTGWPAGISITSTDVNSVPLAVECEGDW